MCVCVCTFSFLFFSWFVFLQFWLVCKVVILHAFTFFFGYVCWGVQPQLYFRGVIDIVSWRYVGLYFILFCKYLIFIYVNIISCSQPPGWNQHVVLANLNLIQHDLQLLLLIISTITNKLLVGKRGKLLVDKNNKLLLVIKYQPGYKIFIDPKLTNEPNIPTKSKPQILYLFHIQHV